MVNQEGMVSDRPVCCCNPIDAMESLEWVSQDVHAELPDMNDPGPKKLAALVTDENEGRVRPHERFSLTTQEDGLDRVKAWRKTTRPDTDHDSARNQGR